MDFKFGIKEEKSIAEILGIILCTIGGLCIRAALLMWGWNVVASRFNVPIFNYWEWIVIYYDLRIVGNALFKKNNTNIQTEED